MEERTACAGQGDKLDGLMTAPVMASMWPRTGADCPFPAGHDSGDGPMDELAADELIADNSTRGQQRSYVGSGSKRRRVVVTRSGGVKIVHMQIASKEGGTSTQFVERLKTTIKWWCSKGGIEHDLQGGIFVVVSCHLVRITNHVTWHPLPQFVDALQIVAQQPDECEGHLGVGMPICKARVHEHAGEQSTADDAEPGRRCYWP